MKKEIRIEAIKKLKKLINAKTEIIVVQHSVSRSGMKRKVSAYVIKKNKLIKINHLIKESCLFNTDKNCNIILQGCGMDMHFHLTYSIKRELCGDKKAINNQQYYSIY